jgi:hypothetical protein
MSSYNGSGYIRMWALTKAGMSVARNTNNPDNASYRIVHHLDQMRRAETTDQIVSGTGLDSGTVGIALGYLSRSKPPLVVAVG